MNRKHCKLDDQGRFTFELEKLDNKTYVTIIDRKTIPEEMPYKGFTNLVSYVDNYRLLQLADFIYDYCKKN